MRALAADGTLLGEAALPANVAPEVPYNLVIRRRGIARAELWAEPVPGGQLLLLDRLCIQLLIGVDDAIYLERVVAWLEEVGTLLAPSAPDGGPPTHDRGLRRWSRSSRRNAALRRSSATDPTPAIAGHGPGCSSLLPTLQVGIVSSCFTTTSAVEAADAAEAGATTCSTDGT